MPTPFINLDAQFLDDMSKLTVFGPDDFKKLAHLAIIAQRLEKMDNRSTSAYSRGFADGRNSTYARSNVEKDPGPANLEEALAVWHGEVTTLPPSEKKAHDNTLTADDLEF